MGFFGSLLGAGLGWWLLGPIGGIMGLVFGHLSEENSSFINKDDQRRSAQNRNGFLASLLVLMAAVMKVDGKIVKAELDFVKRSLVASFGENQASEALLMLRSIVKQQIPLNDVLSQIKRNLKYASKLELIHLLYGIANADGKLSRSEQELIHNIAIGIGVSHRDFESIKSTFGGSSLAAAYKVLEIDENASDIELKKAYRRMAVRFHPDKVAQLGDDVRRGAEEKFKKVGEAYELIKKDRGMK